jgi:serine/threonine-protein kinase HipA
VINALTGSHADKLRAYRRMVFNVAAHNRDDHVKNFAFTMDNDGLWSLSPAYDLTYAPGPGGEHTLTVLGEGRQPTREHCLKLAQQFMIRDREAQGVFEEVNEAVGRWSRFADEAGCTKAATRQIGRQLMPF